MFGLIDRPVNSMIGLIVICLVLLANWPLHVLIGLTNQLGLKIGLIGRLAF